MFGLFKKKQAKNNFTKILPQSLDIGGDSAAASQNFLTIIDGFPRFLFQVSDVQGKAESADEGVENKDPKLNQSEAYHRWLQALMKSFGEGFSLYESQEFMLISPTEEKHVSLFLKSMENIHYRIKKVLGELCVQREHKLVIIILDDIDRYYQYISYYYPSEGEFARSGGVFLNDVFPHFVLPESNLQSAQSAAAHELTHAMVAYLKLPVWLDEGIAVNLESTITGYNPFRLTREKHLKHQAFWRTEEVQQFWSGDSFSRADEGNELSYQLAQLIVRSLAEDHDAFYQFVRHADRNDGGEAAIQKYYGIGLADIVENVFGEGDWKPQPKMW